jgi:hypothetical protein
MPERKNIVTMKGKPIVLLGNAVKVGEVFFFRRKNLHNFLCALA